MNTDPYERRLGRELESEPSAPQTPYAGDSALAVHRDPSLTAGPTGPSDQLGRPSVAWVRPSELPTTVGAKFIRRGIDLQSELTRRARRAPRTATRSAQRISRRAIAQPEPTAPTTERGIEL